MAEKKEFLSLPEAAVIMGVSRIAVFKKVKKGQLAAIRIGRNWAVPAAALELPAFAAPRSAVPPPRKVLKSAPPLSPAIIEEPPARKDSMDEMGWD